MLLPTDLPPFLSYFIKAAVIGFFVWIGSLTVFYFLTNKFQNMKNRRRGGGRRGRRSFGKKSRKYFVSRGGTRL